MKFSVKPQLLKTGVLLSSILGLFLQNTLYTTGIDETGLLITGHWAQSAVWILTAAVFAGLLLLVRSLRCPEDSGNCFPASVAAGIGTSAAAAAVLLATLQAWNLSDNLATVSSLLGLAAALCLAVIALCRFAVRKPFFLLHATVCVYFALRVICLYRFWSSDPQLQDYIFCLGAYVALMLFAYHHAAFDAGMGTHRPLWFWSMAAVYLCCLSVPASQDNYLLILAVWAFSNTTCLQNSKQRTDAT